jgi:cytochrome c2
VIGLEIKKSMQESYPDIFPGASVSEVSPIRKGFKVFTQACFTCHTMNLQGESHMGPDLNSPMSPTEYFKEGILQKFVRNPKSVRQWPSAAMPPFPKEVVSEGDLENLIHYFKHMSTRRPKGL